MYGVDFERTVKTHPPHRQAGKGEKPKTPDTFIARTGCGQVVCRETPSLCPQKAWLLPQGVHGGCVQIESGLQAVCHKTPRRWRDTADWPPRAPDKGQATPRRFAARRLTHTARVSHYRTNFPTRFTIPRNLPLFARGRPPAPDRVSNRFLLPARNVYPAVY
jgi:hypothetical protein